MIETLKNAFRNKDIRKKILCVGEETKYPELMRAFNGGKDIVDPNYLQVTVPTFRSIEKYLVSPIGAAGPVG